MARSDILVQLVKAGITNNQPAFKRWVETLIAEERAQSHDIFAAQLEEHLRFSKTGLRQGLENDNERAFALFFENCETKTLFDLCLADAVQATCAQIVQEQHRRELLRSYNLEPRNRLILTGPPGNGKTSLAVALANALMIPMLSVRYDAVIGSYLGETATRLQRLFDYARTRPCLLFFDEFETIGKERGDSNETGEIKRVVSSLLLQIDKLPSHVVVIAATNHPELLDRAVWRRFQLHLQLDPPSEDMLVSWLSKFEESIGKPLGARLRQSVVRKLQPCSYAELEEFCLNVHRRYILSQPNEDLKGIVADCIREHCSRMSVEDQE